MQSRSKKIRRSYNNYEQAIEKQLNDDFQVYEYLGENQIDGNNIDEYLKLLDSLLVTKQEKTKRFNSLTVNFSHMNSENEEKSIRASHIETWGGAKELFLEEYQKTQIASLNQMEIKNNLEKQIVQTKKSLNLLKGDIGHLVGRNESAKLLESKISKVKIVADDQLKRVSMANIKDKEQIKLRSQMQKKFDKKLKNVSVFEGTTVSKLKKNYISSMVKKKAIHDRLNFIERVGQSVNGVGHIERQKNLNNKVSMDRFIWLSKVCALIERIPERERLSQQSSEEQPHPLCAYRIKVFVSWMKDEQNYYSNDNLQPFMAREQPMSSFKSSRSIQLPVLPSINSEDVEVIDSERLLDFQKIIVEEYARMIESIEKNTKIYNLEMKKNQEAVEKIDKLEQDLDQIFSDLTDERGQSFCITSEIRGQYSQKMKKFISFLKTVFVLLEYLEKSVNYSSMASNFSSFRRKSENDSEKSIKEKEAKSSKKKENNLSIESETVNPLSESRGCRNSTEYSVSRSHDRDYISELHRNYYELLNDDPYRNNLSTVQPSLFQHLQEDVQNWMFLIKEYFMSGVSIKMPMNSLVAIEKEHNKNCKPRKLISKMRDSRALPAKTPKVETEEEEITELKNEMEFSNMNYLRHHTVHKEENIQRVHSFSKTSANFSHSPNNLKKNFRSTLSIQRSPHLRSGNSESSHNGQIFNANKLKRISNSSHKNAERIQLLENIDKDYYKMLKSTIQMEKENTRKNYQFLRTFKSAKYSSRDEILEEKRFESSFSMLFMDPGPNRPLNQRASQIEEKKSHFFKKNSSSMDSSMMEEGPFLSKKSTNTEHKKRGSELAAERNTFKQSHGDNKENPFQKVKQSFRGKTKNLRNSRQARDSSGNVKEILKLM